MPQNLTNDGGLTWDAPSNSLQIAGGATGSFGIIGGQASLVITGQNGDGSVVVRLIGLPRSDPQSEGRLWINNGALMISDG